jgi:hypothetical protein
MRIHLFQSALEPDILGFTYDKRGANLPIELGPWTRAGRGAAIEAGPSRGALTGTRSSGSMIAAIEKDGFYIAHSETFSRDTGIP